MDTPRLRTVLGNHAHVRPLQRGELRSDLFDLEFIDYSPTNLAFKPMVREQEFARSPGWRIEADRILAKLRGK
jgi:4,5-dihydroxyphthalate decarboxylase